MVPKLVLAALCYTEESHNPARLQEHKIPPCVSEAGVQLQMIRSHWLHSIRSDVRSFQLTEKSSTAARLQGWVIALSIRSAAVIILKGSEERERVITPLQDIVLKQDHVCFKQVLKLKCATHTNDTASLLMEEKYYTVPSLMPVYLSVDKR